MGYSLGDDKKSFDIYKETNEICEKIAKELFNNNWQIHREYNIFSKNERILILELDQDHIDSICIYDNLIDWDEFCKKNDGYELVYSGDEVECGMTYISKNTNIKDFVRKLEQAPLKENKLEYEIITNVKDLDDKHSFAVARVINNNHCVELHYNDGLPTIEYGTRINKVDWENVVEGAFWFTTDMSDDDVLTKLEDLFKKYKEEDYGL